MIRLPVLAVCLAAALGACTSVANGASKLPGQNLDAAVALYGPWTEEITPEGQVIYIWRRSLIARGEKKVCELRVKLGFRRTIGDVVMQGQPDACRLFSIRYEPSTQ